MGVTAVIRRLSTVLGGRRVRSLGRMSRPIGLAVALVLAVACGVVAFVDFGPASADPPALAGAPVPEADMPAIVEGALSCPALTPARLAASLMAASGFNAEAVNGKGGRGIAGLVDADWEKWRPRADAARSDDRANILALAHRLCRTVGDLRAGKVRGDLWEAAVAADAVGEAAVIRAGGVPADQRTHVDTVVGYARWYAMQPQFGASGSSTVSVSSGPAPAGTDAVPLPDAYVADVLAAGRVCPKVPPASIAGQLMAASRFNASMVGAGGAQGIAQFRPEAWEQFRPSATASPWKPGDAIRALGSAMCDLVNELSGLTGASSYTLALAAFQWGTNAVRAANGVPRAPGVKQLSDLTPIYAGAYAQDARLAGPVQSAAPTPSASSSRRAPMATSSQGHPSGPQGSLNPGPLPSFDPNPSYQIKNGLTGGILELPGNETSTGSGVTVQLWQNLRTPDQYWRIARAPAAGYYTITNGFSGKALGIRDSSTENYADVVQLDPNPSDPNQQWSFNDAGDGQFNIVNRRSAKVLDLYGNDWAGGDGTPVHQYDLQTFARDEKWWLTR